MAKWLNASRQWLHKLYIWVKTVLPPVYGPRGQIMLGQGLVSLSFGFAYIGVINIPPQLGLKLITVNIPIPLPLWGVLWFLCAFMLISAAFRVDHARALGFLTALLSLWSLTYYNYFFTTPSLQSGHTNSSFIFATMLMAMAITTHGVARMLNKGKTHGELIEKPGPVSDH